MSIKNTSSIVFFIFSLNGGGAARIALRLAEKYSKFSKIHIITLEPHTGAYFIPNNVHIHILKLNRFHFLPNSIRYYINIIWSLRKFLNKESPSRVVSFIHVANILSLVASIGGKWERIVCERSDLLKTRVGTFWKVIRPFAYLFSSKIVLQNEVDRFYFPYCFKKKIYIARNPLPDLIGPIQETKPRLISVGRLHPVKRYDHLIHLLKPILENNPQIEYWICGEGSLKDNLQETINKNGLKKQIKLMGHQCNIEELVGGSMVFLMASESEGQPNAMLEALIQGVPSACFGTSNCFYEIAAIFPELHIIEEGEDGNYRKTVEKLIANSPHLKLSLLEQKQRLTDWNEISYNQWNKIIL